MREGQMGTLSYRYAPGQRPVSARSRAWSHHCNAVHRASGTGNGSCRVQAIRKDAMKSALALLGGPSVLAKLLPAYNSIGPAEVEAVRRVAEKGCLSGFYGSPGPEYLGGPMVRQFEEAWAAKFGIKHAVSVNSAT